MISYLHNLFLTKFTDSEKVWLKVIFGALIFVILIASFGGVLFYNYGWLDDTANVYFFDKGYFSLTKGAMFDGGRPLYNLMIYFLSYSVDSYSDFTWFRVLGIFLAFILAYYLWNLFIQYGYNKWSSLFITSLVVLTPPVGVYIGWAICNVHILPCIFALIAGKLVITELETHPFHRDLIRSLRIWAGLWLLFLTNLMYQPAASLFLVIPIYAYHRPKYRNQANRNWICILTSFIIVQGIYYVVYEKFIATINPNNYTSNRSGLIEIGDIFEKIVFFFEVPVWRSLTGWSLFYDAFVWGKILTFLFAGFMLFLSGYALRKLQKFNKYFICLFFVTIILGMSPVLILSQNYAPFRVLIFLYMITFYLASCGLIEMLKKFKINTKIQISVASIWILLTIIATSFTLVKGMAEPYESEYLSYKTYIKDNFDKPPAEMIYLKSWSMVPRHDYLRVKHHSEFCYPSYSENYMIKPSLIFIFMELFQIERHSESYRHLLETDIIIVGLDEYWGDSVLPILDGLDIQLGKKRSKMENMSQAPNLGNHPLIGPYVYYNDQWKYADWLGYFKSKDLQNIHHPQLGDFKLVKANGEGIYIQKSEGINYWTSPHAYPYLYDFNNKCWIMNSDNGDFIPLLEEK